jgi:hypothetical protein
MQELEQSTQIVGTFYSYDAWNMVSNNQHNIFTTTKLHPKNTHWFQTTLITLIGGSWSDYFCLPFLPINKYHPMIHQTQEPKMSKPCSLDGENPNLMHHNFPFFQSQKPNSQLKNLSNMGHVRKWMLDFVILPIHWF